MSRTPAYKVTKAALNMLTVQYAQDLEEEGFTVLAITPGVSFFVPSLTHSPLFSLWLPFYGENTWGTGGVLSLGL